ARGIRFDPLDREGEFRLEGLRVVPVSPVGAWLRSLRSVPAVTAGAHPWDGRQPYGDIDATYQAWLRRRRLTDADRTRLRTEAATAGPTVSILMSVGRQPAADVRRSLACVLNQISERWQLCVAVGPEVSRRVRSELTKAAARDRRINVVTLPAASGAAAAWKAALAAASGEYFALLEPGDELVEQALWRAGQILRDEPGVDFLYSDEDQLARGGKHVRPFFK